MTNPPGGDRADVKVPEDLRELYDDCIADDSGCSRTTTSGFMAQLIERIAKLEAANKSLLARTQAPGQPERRPPPPPWLRLRD